MIDRSGTQDNNEYDPRISKTLQKTKRCFVKDCNEESCRYRLMGSKPIKLCCTHAKRFDDY